ncbi:D-alanyl-D-alanine carboxypeptidase family protein [Emcibacter sp. SYSU 3D8]|uniref:D-alanyl-D-alanine carboxypeptidase family protein n=1 Tax=Emcibacter sp. SYSU 3D8 TaxID=3133969 RepID=UPI0031FE4D1E
MPRLHRLPLLLAVIIGLPLAAYAAPPPYEIQAKQAIMVDYTTGTVLMEKNPDERMTPSSMTKMMTDYVIFDALKKNAMQLDEELTVSERAWKMGGSTMFLKVGDRVKVEELLKGTIIVSGNDACVALAEGLGGSVEGFANMMNQMAAQLGMKNSQFVNPHGLSDPEHYSTARDLAILAGHIIRDFPEYYPYYAQRKFAYGENLQTGDPISQQNRNPTLGVVDGVDGLKTGYTEDGGYGVTVSGKRGNTRLILVVNGMPSTRVRAEESRGLMEWGFRNFDTYTLLKAGSVIEEAPVWLGTKAKVGLTVAEDVTLTLSREAKMGAKARIKYVAPVKAGTAKGTQVGTVTVSLPGMDDIQVPLIVAEDIEKVGATGKIGSAIDYLLSGSSGEK